MKTIIFTACFLILSLHSYAQMADTLISERKEKDALIQWITDNDREAFIDTVLLQIEDIGSLNLKPIGYDKRYRPCIVVLRAKLTSADSAALQKEIALQRKFMPIKIPDERKAKEEMPGQYSSPAISLSDPVYLPKERLYVIQYYYYCGAKCGERKVIAYKKTETGFEKVAETITGIS